MTSASVDPTGRPAGGEAEHEQGQDDVVIALEREPDDRDPRVGGPREIPDPPQEAGDDEASAGDLAGSPDHADEPGRDERPPDGQVRERDVERLRPTVDDRLGDQRPHEGDGGDADGLRDRHRSSGAPDNAIDGGG